MGLTLIKLKPSELKFSTIICWVCRGRKLKKKTCPSKIPTAFVSTPKPLVRVGKFLAVWSHFHLCFYHSSHLFPLIYIMLTSTSGFLHPLSRCMECFISSNSLLTCISLDIHKSTTPQQVLPRPTCTNRDAFSMSNKDQTQNHYSRFW